MRKECSGCGKSKLLVDFYPKPRKVEYPDSIAGVSHNCKDCTKLERKQYVVSKKEQCKRSDRKYHLSKYGLTPEDYNLMFLSQEGSCLGCKKHQNNLTRSLVVDHDHTTGKVRGLLCRQCNSGLGCLKDNTDTLFNLIEYLNNSRLVDNKTNIVDISVAKKVG